MKKITVATVGGNSKGLVPHVSLDGLEEMVKAMGALPSEVDRVSRRVATGMAARVRKLARERAPKAEEPYIRYYGKKGDKTKVQMKPGTLRRAIKSQGSRSNRNKHKHFASVYIETGTSDAKDAFHWRFVEYGTENVEARPFIAPAAEQVNRTIEMEMFREVSKQIDKELAKRAKRAAKAAA